MKHFVTAAAGFEFEGYIFRLVSVLGERYTHGYVFDFYRQLLQHPHRLEVFGDRTQRKSYLYIKSCIEAMLHATTIDRKSDNTQRVHIYNLGAPEYCRVAESIHWITGYLGLNPQLIFSGSNRGWVGDNPFIFLDTRRIQETGWQAKLTIRSLVIKTVEWLRENHWVPEKR